MVMRSDCKLARADMSRHTTDTLICGACIRKSAISASVKPFTANLALGFRHAAGGHIAHSDGAALGHQLTNELSTHARAAAGHHGDPAGKVFH